MRPGRVVNDMAEVSPGPGMPSGPALDAALIAQAASRVTRAGAILRLGISFEQAEEFSARHPAVLFRSRDGQVDYSALPVLAAQGLSMPDAAKAMGVPYSNVVRWSRRNPDVVFDRYHKDRIITPPRAAALRAAAAAGSTLAQAIVDLALPSHATYVWARNNPDVVFPKTALLAAISHMTPEQQADYAVLTTKGRYRHAAAIRMVTTPKVRLSAKICVRADARFTAPSRQISGAA